MSFHKFSDLLGELRRRFPALNQRLGEATAVAHWDTAVGPAIAKHARALRVEKGVLWVEVDHPLWKTELHMRKRQIIEKLAVNGNPSITDLFLVDLKPAYSRERSFGTNGGLNVGVNSSPQDGQKKTSQEQEQKNTRKNFPKR